MSKEVRVLAEKEKKEGNRYQLLYDKFSGSRNHYSTSTHLPLY